MNRWAEAIEEKRGITSVFNQARGFRGLLGLGDLLSARVFRFSINRDLKEISFAVNRNRKEICYANQTRECFSRIIADYRGLHFMRDK